MTSRTFLWSPNQPEEKQHVSLDGITIEKFDGIVKKLGTSNEDRAAAAIDKADTHSFLAANSFWFKNTDTNRKLVDSWLRNKGIIYLTYPDAVEASETLAKAGLLDVDEAGWAQYLDGNGPKKFKGALTGRSYDSLDSMIAQEREAALNTVEKQSDIEEAFDALPAEQALQMLRDADKHRQAQADAQVSQDNADSWKTLHPEYRDDTANGKLMLAQLRQNGVVNRAVTIEDYEIAERQLVEAGMIRQNPAQLQKQQAAEVLERAKRAVNTPGSVFDKTTEEEMENLSIDELRNRANKQLASR